MSSPLHDFSSALADLLATAAPSVVRVEAGAHPVSGLAWDATTIVTARHGIDADAPISVTTHDGTHHTATLIGHDPRLDLSFLELATGVLPDRPPTAEAPRIGHLVLTLGRGARGLRSSLGIVGSVGPSWRTRGGADVSQDIDVDATLHPTAAGGPLLDTEGRLIGVNTTGLRPGGATLPVDTIADSLAHVRTHGSVRPGMLGVRVRTAALPPTLSAELGQHQGLLVLGTPRQSPAARAGIEAGDVLLTVSGTPVRSLLDLRSTLSTAGGTEVEVRLLRSGETREVQVPVMAKSHRHRGRHHHRGPRGHQGLHGPWGPRGHRHHRGPHGPRHHGPDHHGPDHHGPDDHGPDDHGPHHHGPDHQGQDDHGPDHQGHGDHGPDHQGHGDHGPDGRGQSGRGPDHRGRGRRSGKRGPWRRFRRGPFGSDGRC